MRRINSGPPVEDPLKLVARGLTKLYSIWVSLSYPFAAKGSKLSIHFSCQLSRKRASRISLGNSIQLRENAWLNPAVPENSIGGEPVIVIDDNCLVGSSSILSAKNRIHLERDVLITQSVLIQDHNHAYDDPMLPIVDQGLGDGGRIRICQGSWIGHGAAIICSHGELTIGRNSVVGANSVVTRSIPPYSVVAGVPARIIRQFDPLKRVWVHGSLNVATGEDCMDIRMASPEVE